MSDEPPSVFKWICLSCDYIGLGFILLGTEEWWRLSDAKSLSAIALGLVFLFLGIMGLKIRHRGGIKITMMNRNTGSFTCYRITNHSDKEKRLLSVKMKVKDRKNKVTEDDTVYKRDRFSKLPHPMPPGASIEINYRSINAFIDFNMSKPKSSGLIVKELWLELELEDGTIITGRKYRIPRISSIIKKNRQIEAEENADALKNPDFTPKEMESIREEQIAAELKRQTLDYMENTLGMPKSKAVPLSQEEEKRIFANKLAVVMQQGIDLAQKYLGPTSVLYPTTDDVNAWLAEVLKVIKPMGAHAVVRVNNSHGHVGVILGKPLQVTEDYAFIQNRVDTLGEFIRELGVPLTPPSQSTPDLGPSLEH